MRIVLQAFICSVIIHVTYFSSIFLVGYIKTCLYKPDIASEWDKIDTLQNEVAFGMVISPVLSLLTFIGVAVICGIIILLYKRLLN
ncbi:hypothetical protein [Neobacillus drentensis]|uniref:hypothetical protein n=1 Tax=Neobacillus drentensis TaxID=220684 RepID=UPI003000DD95